jgi:2',3'-cyclic-nucleotide 2'-phosphodiesterase
VRLVLIGDVVGKPGRQLVTGAMPGLRVAEDLDMVVVNAENAAGGSGLTPEIYRELIAAGVDCVTMGDHIYRRREILSILSTEPRIVRPANYPREAPGRPFTVVTTRGKHRVAVISLLGRVFMSPVDCPFHTVDRVLESIPTDVKIILVDFHAEATSDKQLMGRHLDGRVTAVLGTHTHVPTADEQILPGGTAFQCDVGMTGPHESILGRRIDRVMETARTFRPTHFEVATDDLRMHGTIVDVDPATGRATGIRRMVVDEARAAQLSERRQGPTIA